MPAERTKLKRSNTAPGCTQLTWAVPVEPSSPQSIAFAPNVTPGTFNEPPATFEVSTEATLFPPPAECVAPRRPGHSRKKSDNHIPRPPNAFILFRSSFIKSQHVSTEVETNHSTLSKIIGLTWQNLPHDERQVWHAKAKAALDDHKRKFPQYAFRPLHPKTKPVEKRKVREVGPKDLRRCAKIAELLVEGKKGQELDLAVQEFDRHHVPEVVTRFEAPLTARMYRRSSSAPIPDTGHSQANSRSVRASSSQPTRHPSPSPSPSTWSQPHSPSVDAEVDVFYDAAFSPSTSSSESYSFPQTPDPSFDFDTFTFDQSAVAMMHHCTAEVDPLAPLHVQPSIQRNNNVMPLSIDTSLSIPFFDDWTRSSSPQSSMPPTPSNYSPCSSTLPLDSNDDAFAAIASLQHFSMNSPSGLEDYKLYAGDMSSSISPYNSSPSPDLTSHFEYDPALDCKAELANPIDFDTLMGYLPSF